MQKHLEKVEEEIVSLNTYHLSRKAGCQKGEEAVA